MSERENCIIIDWFAMSFREKGVTVHDIIDVLGLPSNFEWRKLPGRYCYRDRLSFDHIHIYYNNVNPDCDFPLLELTGQGCRNFETFSRLGFDHLFELAKDSEKYHMSRLDIAFDEFTGIFDIQKMVGDYFFGNWVSSSFKGRIDIKIEQGKDRIIHGFSLMTGTKSSDMYMRIYDKANERGFFDGRHWIRCELVLKQDRATTFIKNPASLGEKYRGVILKYFRFLSPSKTDSNKRRWKMRKYWADFLGAVEPISVFTPKNIEYNLPRLQKYVFGQGGNSIETLLLCSSMYDFFDGLLNRNSRLTPRQNFLIEQCHSSIDKNDVMTREMLIELRDSFQKPEQKQPPDDPDDPFSDIPIPEPPKGWNDDT